MFTSLSLYRCHLVNLRKCVCKILPKVYKHCITYVFSILVMTVSQELCNETTLKITKNKCLSLFLLLLGIPATENWAVCMIRIAWLTGIVCLNLSLPSTENEKGRRKKYAQIYCFCWCLFERVSWWQVVE